MTKILEGPAALGSFKYVMIWHQRMQTDAAHIWLRSIIREAVRHVDCRQKKVLKPTCLGSRGKVAHAGAAF
jgi:hypothetical protein